MKNLEKVTKKTGIKVYALSVFIFITFTVFNSAEGANKSYYEAAVKEEIHNEDAICLLIHCDVTDEEVYNYLTSRGYRVYKIEYSGDGYDRIVTTAYDYQTIVHVEGGKIVGAEDIQY